MKKKIMIAGVAGVALIAGLVWFLLGRSTNDNSYCNVIPNDAIVVGRMAPMEFMEKNNLKVEELFDRFGLDKSNREKAEEFMKCGADLSSPIYFYMNKASFGLVFRLEDADSFRDYLKKNGTRMTEKDGFYFAEANKTYSFCTDDDKALFYYSLEGEVSNKDVIKLMKQDKDKSIMATDLYKQLEECGKSMAVNMKIREVNELTSSLLSSDQRLLYSILYPKMPDCNALMTADAEGDELKFMVDIIPNSDQAKKDLDAMLAEYSAIQGDLMDMGMEHPAYWFCFGIPGKKLQELASSPLLTELIPQISKDYDLPGALSGFDGDLAIAMDFNGPGNDVRVLGMTRTKNDKYVGSLKMLASQTNGSMDLNLVHDGGSDFHLTQTSAIGYTSSYDDNEYDFDYIDEFVDDDYSGYEDGAPACPSTKSETIAYLSRQGDILVATNSEPLKSGALQKTDALKGIKDEVKGCMMYLYIDLQQIVKSLESLGTNSTAQSRAILEQVKHFDYIKAYAKGSHGEMIMKTTGGKNFVELVIEMMETSL